jgi:hypothetical protein
MLTVTKIQVRQGTDVQRRTANSTGIVFSTGEPAFCIDTKRLFIGDGNTAGGIPIGIQNLGAVTSLFGAGTNGYSSQALSVFAASGASVGDIIYDKDTRGIYSLSSVTSFPPLTSDLVKYDLATLINTDQFQYNSSQELQIKSGGIGPIQLGPTIVDESTLTKVYNGPISVKINGVSNPYFAEMPSYSVKGNSEGYVATPVDIELGPNQFVGRTSTSQLTGLAFETLLTEANFTSQNGITIDKSGVAPVWSLDTSLLSANDLKITLKRDTDITGAVSIVGNTQVTGTLITTGNTTVQGTLYCFNDVIAFSTSDLSLKENISQIKNPLNKISLIRGYNFNWKNNDSTHLTGSDTGLIAQEIERIIPEAVITRESGIKAVNYNKVIPLLVECINTLKEEIDTLKNEIRKAS